MSLCCLSVSLLVRLSAVVVCWSSLSPAKIHRCMEKENIIERLSAMHWRDLKMVIVEAVVNA